MEFEELYRSHFLHLCNFADQFVADSGTSKDIVQKVFVALWEKRATVQSGYSVRAYLFTAVKNRCLNHIRDRKKYRSHFLDLECGDFEMISEDGFLEFSDLQKEIDRALETLPDKCRLVFEMSRFKDMKYKSIAAELDISEKTVEAHMTKALKTLKSYLKKYLMVIQLIITGFNL